MLDRFPGNFAQTVCFLSGILSAELYNASVHADRNNPGTSKLCPLLDNEFHFICLGIPLIKSYTRHGFTGSKHFLQFHLDCAGIRSHNHAKRIAVRQDHLYRVSHIKTQDTQSMR